MKTKPIKVFYCYAPKDKQLLEKLRNHLCNLSKQGKIEEWYDDHSSTGEKRKPEINKHLGKADIILLLISADFISSSYFEVLAEYAKQKKFENRLVIPVILKRVNWESTSFRGGKLGDLQPLPEPERGKERGTPVSEWKNREEAFYNIAKGIKDEVDKIISAKHEAEQQAKEKCAASKFADKEGLIRIFQFLKSPFKFKGILAVLGLLFVLSAITYCQKHYIEPPSEVEKKFLKDYSYNINNSHYREAFQMQSKNFQEKISKGFSSFEGYWQNKEIELEIISKPIKRENNNKTTFSVRRKDCTKNTHKCNLMRHEWELIRNPQKNKWFINDATRKKSK